MISNTHTLLAMNEVVVEHTRESYKISCVKALNIEDLLEYGEVEEG